MKQINEKGNSSGSTDTCTSTTLTDSPTLEDIYRDGPLSSRSATSQTESRGMPGNVAGDVQLKLLVKNMWESS
ncbi:hypothetical protein DPMN_008863 [Dreissena polymorpha]|uniref:Uncharacterized protein n=1 Tax=Dreissena polymorpha TaxID=45954 RepID=A0A9D4N1A3_DREPO|nr:hypothetical protein DPMN_008863 [Dreissena polymorpha]